MAYTAENRPYKIEADTDAHASSSTLMDSDSLDNLKSNPPTAMKFGQKASYTPSSNINEFAYGKSGGKANAQSGNIPSVEANGSVVGQLPKMPGGNFRIGEDKNVSTPVSG